jgi:hypothetical protein
MASIGIPQSVAILIELYLESKVTDMDLSAVLHGASNRWEWIQSEAGGRAAETHIMY